MNRIHVFAATGPGVSDQDIEIVERKGIGHPDTICDSLMEEVSLALCREYVRRAGTILHHNCDKALLVAGQVAGRWGGGEVTTPMRLIIGDRATIDTPGGKIDAGEIAVETARQWFRENLRFVDPASHIVYQVELRPGSTELAGIFDRPERVRAANDSSAVAGYAPLSETERLVLRAEEYLNSKSFKEDHPESGEDVKVLGVRLKKEVTLTVGMPLLDRFLLSEADYFRKKSTLEDALLTYLREKVESVSELRVRLNTLDQSGRDLDGLYTSVLGTSAEQGDSGEVGRGNRVNGLISLFRPGGAEAAAGKNPVSHVGKIYNVLAHFLASKLHREIEPLNEATVWMCSNIGQPVDRPLLVGVELRLEPGVELGEVEPAVREFIERELERMPAFCRSLAQGHYRIC